MPKEASVARKWLISGALAVGVAIGAAAIANAVTSDDAKGTSTTTVPAAATTSTLRHTISGNGDPGNGPQDGFPGGPGRGFGDQEITGPVADQAIKAIVAKYPRAQVERVIKLTAGGYVAHVFPASGEEIRVLLDKNLNVTGTQAGGPGPAAPGGLGGRPSLPSTTTRPGA